MDRRTARQRRHAREGPRDVRARLRPRGTRGRRCFDGAAWQLRRMAQASAGRAIDMAYAVKAVTAAPINAYHVQPHTPVHHTQAITTMPVTIPASIAFAPTRTVRTPVRKAPSTGPAASDRPASPASSTDFVRN